MAWKKILSVLLLLLPLAESLGRSRKLLPFYLVSQSNVLSSWPILSAGVFVAVSLVLSLFLISEHLAVYNQPEVFCYYPFIYVFQLLVNFRKWSSNFVTVQLKGLKEKTIADLNVYKATCCYLMLLSSQVCLVLMNISGAEVLDWSHSNGSCICSWVGM